MWGETEMDNSGDVAIAQYINSGNTSVVNRSSRSRQRVMMWSRCTWVQRVQPDLYRQRSDGTQAHY